MRCISGWTVSAPALLEPISEMLTLSSAVDWPSFLRDGNLAVAVTSVRPGGAGNHNRASSESRSLCRGCTINTKAHPPSLCNPLCSIYQPEECETWIEPLQPKGSQVTTKCTRNLAQQLHFEASKGHITDRLYHENRFKRIFSLTGYHVEREDLSLIQHDPPVSTAIQ